MIPRRGLGILLCAAWAATAQAAPAAAAGSAASGTDSTRVARPAPVASSATRSAPGTARIGYLAGATAYVDAGRADGLLEGDTLEVTRGGAVVARLRVTYLSTQRAACDTLAVLDGLRVGDAVRFTPHAAPDIAEAGPAPAAADSAAGPAAVAAPTRKARTTRLHGRIGARFLGVRESGGGGFNQPALDLRLDGADLGGAPIQLGVDLRGHRTSRTLPGGGLAVDSDTRVYRFSMTLHDRRDRRRLTLGRQSSPALAGVSLFDGALLEAAGTRWSAGLFSGTQPDPLRFGWSKEILEHGVYVGLHQRPLATRRWSFVTGGVTSWQAGQPNRDFLFTQAFYGDRRWTASLAQEADINRGWKRASGEPGFSLTSSFLTTRYELSRAFSLRAGFDNRRNVRLYRDRLTPETEFDDRYRQGAWLGSSLELWSHLRLDGDGRTNGGADHARTASGGLEVHRLTRYSVSMNGRFSQFTSDASVSRLVTLRLGCAPAPPLHVQFSGGSRATTDQVSATRETVRWGSADFDLVFARRWFVSASIERDRGGLENLSQGYATLSWRF